MHDYFVILLIYPTLEYGTVNTFHEDGENTYRLWYVYISIIVCFSDSSINITIESALPPPILTSPSPRRNLHPRPADRDDGQYKGTRTTACL